MKFLRFIILLLAILTAYFAQILFQSPNLLQTAPVWLFDLAPFRSLLFWSPDNLQRLALLLAAAGAVLYGLLVQPLPANLERRVGLVGARSARIGGTLLLLAVAIGAGLLLFTRNSPGEPLSLHLFWAISLLSVLLGGWWLTSVAPPAASEPASNFIQPERGWPYFLLILGVAALLYSWQLNLLPIRVDAEIANHGLQAMRILSGEESRIFAPGWANLPLLAYYPAALGMLVSGDWLVGARLAGVFAGLLTLLGVWLLACELFRRSPISDAYGFLLQDNGRHAALLAVVFTGIGYTFVHFSRLPHFMEPVAWGTLSLWALARGLRANDRLALGLSGLLLGMTLLLYESGLIFPIVALMWLLGYLWARSHWFRPADGGVSWAGIAVWLAGIFVFLAPTLGFWLRQPALLAGRIETISFFNFWENVRRTALTFNVFGDTSAFFGFGGAMLDPLVAPLLILGVGVILLNLDRLLSWQLLAWLVGVILLGGALMVEAPFWPRLLPALPAIGLIIALAVDRWRATLLTIGGPWLKHLGTVALAGLLLLAGVESWVQYYEANTVGAEPATYVGRALRVLAAEEVPFLVVGDGRPAWNEPVIEYLGATRYRPLLQGELQIDDLPTTLPPHSVILLFPEDQVLATTLQIRYPGGIYRVQRDRLGNPTLVIYELP
ncbi:MAG: hypothetical protein KF893_24010 [Caldilineaceae bacterium]|nr:hypothetical protein [Caldilineaceae bacterium]